MRCRPGRHMPDGGSKRRFLPGRRYICPAVRRHLLRLRGLQQKACYGSLSPMLLSLRVQSVSQSVFGLSCTLAGTLQVPCSLYQWGCLMAVSLLCTVFAFCTLMTGVRILELRKHPSSTCWSLQPEWCLASYYLKKTVVKIMIGCACILVSTLITVLARDSRKDGGKKI